MFGEVKQAEWMAHKNVKFVVCLSSNTYRKKTGKVGGAWECGLFRWGGEWHSYERLMVCIATHYGTPIQGHVVGKKILPQRMQREINSCLRMPSR